MHRVKTYFNNQKTNNMQQFYNSLEKLSFEEWKNQWLEAWCSTEHEFEYVYKESETGRIMLYQQCQICGIKSTSGSLKHDNVPNLKDKIKNNQIKKFCEKLEESGPTYERYYNEYYLPLLSRQKFLIEKEKENQLENWRKEHNEYLQTLEWKMIRQKVLKRDNFLCQGCLENQATQVHHKTYDHWKNEFMYELISLCRSCHEREHNINQ